MMFVPERPYIPPGTLRDALLHTGQEKLVSDEQILAILHSLKLESVLRRIGGLDTERKWSDLLSLSEQQLLAFARVLIAAPSFVFLDQPTRALSDSQVNGLLNRLRERGITYLTLGDDDDPAGYNQLLEIAEDGSWKLSALPPLCKPAAPPCRSRRRHATERAPDASFIRKPRFHRRDAKVAEQFSNGNNQTLCAFTVSVFLHE